MQLAMLASSLMGKYIWTSVQLKPKHRKLKVLFFVFRNKPYSIFKPGQTQLERDYYKDATKEQANGNNCLANFNRFGSEYDKHVSATIKPGDYQVPSKDANGMIEYELMNNPSLFAHTRRARYDPAKTETMMRKTGQKNPGNTTKHWQSNYMNTNETQMKAPITISERPLWSYPRQAYTSKRGYFHTENQMSIGTFGHNPRNKLPQTADKQINEHHDLTAGTTKTTTHIPGYNGFIPKTNFNPHAVNQASSLSARETIIKQNMIENY